MLTITVHQFNEPIEPSFFDFVGMGAKEGTKVLDFTPDDDSVRVLQLAADGMHEINTASEVLPDAPENEHERTPKRFLLLINGLVAAGLLVLILLRRR